MNVDVAAAVPAAAVKVTLTPVFQFELVSVTLVGECAIAVLPDRVMVTATELAGAALKRIDEVPLEPPTSDNVPGVAVMDNVCVP